MSRTAPETHMSSPVEHILEWVGHDSGGFFKVYDKETKTTHEVPLPLRFAFLDCKRGVSGFWKKVKSGLFSNEVHSVKTEEMSVKYRKDGETIEVVKGIWSDIKDNVEGKGGKFCSNVYATLLTSTDAIGGGSLVKLSMSGCCNSAWIDAKIKDGESFEIASFVEKMNGTNKYREPVLVKIEITDDEGAIADEQDVALQKYFDSKKAVLPDAVEKHEEIPTGDEHEDDDVPF